MPIVENLDAVDVIGNVENLQAKDRLFDLFTGKGSVNLEKYAKKCKESQKVILVYANRKITTALVNKAKRLEHHAFLKKKAKRQHQSDTSKKLKYKEDHEFIWKLVTER